MQRASHACHPVLYVFVKGFRPGIERIGTVAL